MDSRYPSQSKNTEVAFSYHVFSALALLLYGSGVLALGIWLQVRDNGHAFLLEHGPNRFLDFVLESGVFAVFLGLFMIVVAVNALIARATRCTTGCVYTIISAFVLFLLVSTSIVCWIVYAQRGTKRVRGFYQGAWKFTLKEKPLALCEIQKALFCRGFNDVSCKTEECPVCPPKLQVRKRSSECYTAIVKDLAQNFLPVAICSTLLSLIMVIDLVLHCKC